MVSRLQGLSYQPQSVDRWPSGIGVSCPTPCWLPTAACVDGCCKPFVKTQNQNRAIFKFPCLHSVTNHSPASMWFPVCNTCGALSVQLLPFTRSCQSQLWLHCSSPSLLSLSPVHHSCPACTVNQVLHPFLSPPLSVCLSVFHVYL